MIKKETYIFTGIITALSLLAYSFLFFFIPFPIKDSNGHILNYVTALVLAITFVCSFLLGLWKRKDVTGLVYRIPLIKLIVGFAIANVIVSIIECIINAFVPMPFYAPIIVGIFELIFFFSLFVLKRQNITHIENNEDKQKEMTSVIKELRTKANVIFNNCNDDVSKENMKKVVDALQYSDPVSSKATIENDGEIASLLDQLEETVNDGKSITSVDEILKAISKRNIIAINNK